jgi:hypothetical protein
MSPQVPKNLGIRAASLFQSIGQDRQPLEGPLFIDALGQLGDRGVIPRQERRIEGNGPKKERSEEIVQKRQLTFPHGPPGCNISRLRQADRVPPGEGCTRHRLNHAKCSRSGRKRSPV